MVGPDDVIAVAGPDELGFLLFQFSGARLANRDDPRLVGNDVRIRYADLARAWDDRMAGEGFRPEYLALPAAGEPGQRYIVSGDYDGARWVLIKLSR